MIISLASPHRLTSACLLVMILMRSGKRSHLGCWNLLLHNYLLSSSASIQENCWEAQSRWMTMICLRLTSRCGNTTRVSVPQRAILVKEQNALPLLRQLGGKILNVVTRIENHSIHRMGSTTNPPSRIISLGIGIILRLQNGQLPLPVT